MGESRDENQTVEEKIRRERLEQFSNELKERVVWNQTVETPSCTCLESDYKYNETRDGTYYTHLGAGPTLAALRRVMEARTGLSGDELRFEKLCYTGREGKSSEGCPVAKWIIRRSSYEEKMLILVRYRPGHCCSTSWMIIGIVCWDGVDSTEADQIYDLLSSVLPSYGEATERRCGINELRTCACQGFDPKICGTSYSFGCSWSMYNNACKFAKTKGNPRKFRIKSSHKEDEIDNKLQNLASALGPLYRKVAPDAFLRQTEFEGVAASCRLGTQPGRPFAGVTTCIDYCTHSHRDVHNMNNGCTVIVSLMRHRDLTRADDEQLHVLPLYILDSSDEWGSSANQWRKVEMGQIEMLTSFPRLSRIRGEPLASCSARKRARREARLEQAKVAEAAAAAATSLPKVAKPSVSKENQVTAAEKTDLLPDNADESLPTISDWFRKPISDYWGIEGAIGFELKSESQNTEEFFIGDFIKTENTFPECDIRQNDSTSFFPADTNETKLEEASAKNKKETPGLTTGINQEYWTQNEDIFLDPEVGGVGIALTHGSVYFEVSKRELHATTSLLRPNRCDPTRISLVFYQHKNLHYWSHGSLEWERKKKNLAKPKKETSST